MDFGDDKAAKEWIILNQFGRRNINNYQRSVLALELKPIIAEKAKERQLSTLAQNKTDVQISAPRGKTRDELAAIAGVSHDTISKVEKIELSASEDVKAQVRSGEISVNQAYQAAVGENKPHVSNNSGENEWYTPIEYINAAREVMGSIDLDPASCAIANNTVKASKIFTIDDDGLKQKWHGNVWLNPPYASDLIGKFADKVAASKGDIQQAIILVNNATETGWFNTLISVASAIVFPKSRVKFYMADGKTGAPLQGQAFIYVGNCPHKFLDVFKAFGWGAIL
jgi:ParB family chromosome partitioning protein